MTKRRDIFVYNVSTWLFNHIATKEYRAFAVVNANFGRIAMEKYFEETTDE